MNVAGTNTGRHCAPVKVEIRTSTY